MEEVIVRAEPTYQKRGNRYPLWLDDPSQVWNRGWVPLRLCRPDASREEVDAWEDAAAAEVRLERLEVVGARRGLDPERRPRLRQRRERQPEVHLAALVAVPCIVMPRDVSLRRARLQP